MPEHADGRPRCSIPRTGGSVVEPDGLIDEEPARHISALRVLVVLVVLAMAVAGGSSGCAPAWPPPPWCPEHGSRPTST